MTDKKKKQIEEMVTALHQGLKPLRETCDTETIAEILYDAGYRKPVEGEWLECTEYNELEDCEDEFYQCSVCGLCTPCAPNFCMDCGAKMSGGNGNDR